MSAIFFPQPFKASFSVLVQRTRESGKACHWLWRRFCCCCCRRSRIKNQRITWYHLLQNQKEVQLSRSMSQHMILPSRLCGVVFPAIFAWPSFRPITRQSHAARENSSHESTCILPFSHLLSFHLLSLSRKRTWLLPVTLLIDISYCASRHSFATAEPTCISCKQYLPSRTQTSATGNTIVGK